MHFQAVPFYKSITIYFIVSLFLFFEMAVQVSPSVMSSQLMHDLDISAFGLGIMSGIYFYTYTAMQIPSGFLLDRFSPRLIITLSILTCSIGSMLFATADNIYLGSLARLLMGSGSAFAFVSVLVVTADLFPAKYFAALVGVTQMLAALGAMAGQMPVGVLLDKVGWRDTMLILSLIGLVLALVVWCLVNYTKIKPRGTVIPSNIRDDLKKILCQPQTWYIALYSCLLWAPMSGFASLWGVPFITSVHHFNQTESALLCSFMWLGLAFASPLLGILSTAMQNRVFPLALAAFIGTVSFGLVLEFEFSKVVLGALLFLAGAACSGQALCFAVIKENNPLSIKGTAIAFNNIAVVISGAIFQPLIGKFISVSAGQDYNPDNFKHALSILFFCYLIAFFIAVIFIKETKGKSL
jgi:MFS family permease